MIPTPKQKAVSLLRRKINDRPRELFPCDGSLLLLDDSGGESITRFDDATAVYYFLHWLTAERKKRAKQTDIRIRRASLTLHKGSKK